MDQSAIVLFETEDRAISMPVQLTEDTVWLNRSQMAELFERDVKTIGKHIHNALREELDNSVVAKFATTASDGKHNRHPARKSPKHRSCTEPGNRLCFFLPKVGLCRGKIQ